MHPLRWILLLFCLPLASLAKDPTDWKSGRLLDLTTASESRVIGFNGMVGTRILTVYTYSVDGGEKVYEAKEALKQAPHVEVNSSIQYSVSKDYLYVKDSNGKVHKLALVKTTRKE
jgi:hypothetical protein